MRPVFPQKHLLPWALLAASLVLVVVGILTGDRSTMMLGGAGLAATIIGYPLARLVLGAPPPDEAPADEPPPS